MKSFCIDGPYYLPDRRLRDIAALWKIFSAENGVWKKYYEPIYKIELDEELSTLKCP
jgi:hypothetical protein